MRRLACILLVLGLGGHGVAAGQGAAVHAVACHARAPAPFTLPDPGCTPGAVDPRVTQSDIATTICRSGYTRTVRPPESVTYREKRASMRAYGDHGPTRRYEYDHLIPLELGGAPNDTRNLWPEPGGTPNRKDRLESRLRRDVCAGRVTLAAARREIARNWVAAYRRLLRQPSPTWVRAVAGQGGPDPRRVRAHRAEYLLPLSGVSERHAAHSPRERPDFTGEVGLTRRGQHPRGRRSLALAAPAGHEAGENDETGDERAHSPRLRAGARSITPRSRTPRSRSRA